MPVKTPSQWQVTGPYRCLTFEEFLKPEAPESVAVWPANWRDDGRTLPTLTVSSRRSWVDLTWEYRGRKHLWSDYAKAESDAERTLTLFSDKPVAVSAYARTTIDSKKNGRVNLRIAFDDWLTLWVNGEKIATHRHDRGFEIANFPVDLREGENTIQVKLSNFDNQEHRLWAFSFAVEEKELE